MKVLIFIICFIIGDNLRAQNCQTSLLFKKGTILEYKNFVPKGFFGSKLLECTRLVFEVQDVKDSNNITYSYIRKTGINPKNEELKYHRNLVLRCDGNTIYMPVGFYNIDTIFFSNMNPGVKDKGIYSSSIIKGNCDFQFPMDFQQKKFAMSCSQYTTGVKMRELNKPLIRIGPEDENTIETKIKDIKSYGKESVTVTAGSYECNKIMLDCELDLFKRTDVTMIFQFNPEAGVVRFSGQANFRSGYMELVKVTK